MKLSMKWQLFYFIFFFYFGIEPNLRCPVHRSDSRDVMEWSCETARIPLVVGVKQHPVRPSQ